MEWCAEESDDGSGAVAVHRIVGCTPPPDTPLPRICGREAVGDRGNSDTFLPCGHAFPGLGHDEFWEQVAAARRGREKDGGGKRRRNKV